MKPLFAVDVTVDKKNEKINGEEFITRRLSEGTRRLFETKTENLEATVKKSQLPTWLQVVKYICSLLALIALVSIIRADVSIEQGFKNAPWIFIGGIICALIWLGLHLYSKKKEKEVLAEENAEEQVEDINTDIKDILLELGVPYSAPDIDVMMFRYKVKDGEIKLKAAAMQMSEYLNFSAKIYQQNGELHIADLDSVYSFKMSEIKAIRSVKKHTTLSSWNKEVGPTEEKYKPYKLGVDQYGMIHIKAYHILEIEHAGEVLGIYFPSYEIDTLERATGLRAEEISK